MRTMQYTFRYDESDFEISILNSYRDNKHMLVKVDNVWGVWKVQNIVVQDDAPTIAILARSKTFPPSIN